LCSVGKHEPLFPLTPCVVSRRLLDGLEKGRMPGKTKKGEKKKKLQIPPGKQIARGGDYYCVFHRRKSPSEEMQNEVGKEGSQEKKKEPRIENMRDDKESGQVIVSCT